MNIVKYIVIGLLAWTIGVGSIVSMIFVKDIQAEGPLIVPTDSTEAAAGAHADVAAADTSAADSAAHGASERQDAPILQVGLNGQTVETHDTGATPDPHGQTAAQPPAAHGQAAAGTAAVHGQAAAQGAKQPAHASSAAAKPASKTRRGQATAHGAKPAAHSTKPAARGPKPAVHGAKPDAGHATAKAAVLRAPGAPDLPLAREESTLRQVPAWRIDRGLYRAEELARWEHDGAMRFVPAESRVEVLERHGELARVRIVGEHEAVAGWTYSRFLADEAR